MLYVFCLKLVRRLRTYRRRLWGRIAPHWARDIYGVVQNIDFLSLVPTLVALPTAPRHFFRRLPTSRENKNGLHLTPIAFFVRALLVSVVLLLLLSRGSGLQAGAVTIFLTLGVIAALAPIWIIGVALMLLLLFQVPRLISSHGEYHTPAASHFCLLILSPRTYAQLRWKKYLWGLCYYSIYLLLAWQFLEVAVLFAGGAFGLVAVGLQADPHAGHLECELVVVTVFLLALFAYWLIGAPYLELLRASARIPSIRFHLADVSGVRSRADFILKNLERPSGGMAVWTNTTGVRGLGKKLLRLRTTALLQDYDARHLDSELRTRLRTERWSVYEAAMRRAAFEKVVKRTDLSDAERQWFSWIVGIMDAIWTLHGAPTPRLLPVRWD
jgi:hypothetical protein